MVVFDGCFDKGEESSPANNADDDCQQSTSVGDDYAECYKHEGDDSEGCKCHAVALAFEPCVGVFIVFGIAVHGSIEEFHVHDGEEVDVPNSVE